MNRPIRSLLGALLGIAGMAQLAPVEAQAWPSKPIHLIVAYPAGGGLDLVARTVAQRLSEGLGQQVVVENRSGASGSIGADYVARAAADGYTLLMASPAEVVVGPAAGQKVPYNPESDLLPVALAGETPLVIVVNPAVPAKNLAEFIAYAKASPGKLSYGTPGTGSSMQFAGEALNAGIGAQIQHVPYRGAAPALNDALGNQVPIAIVGMPPTVGHVKSGKLRAIAVTSAKRSSLMPDVPAVAELPGMKDYRFTNWMGVFAPARTPAPVVDRLGAEIAKMMQEPATRKLLLDNGVEPQGLRGVEFAAFLKSERQRYAKVAAERGIRFEE
ncbi:MAG: tripartite tricarboxylate transporter substrate binding protein [Pseudomonadota bacterium]|nr:tripartite tricarboxylate transporter substrate binding protein [Pseudomonadota bacterium]